MEEDAVLLPSLPNRYENAQKYASNWKIEIKQPNDYKKIISVSLRRVSHTSQKIGFWTAIMWGENK